MNGQLREYFSVCISYSVARGPPLLYKSSAHCHKRRVPSDWARACRDWRVQPYGFTATHVPTRPVVDSLPLRRKPRWLKRATGTFLRAGAPFKARALLERLVQSYNRTATRVPARTVVDSLPLRRKPRWLKRATGTFLRAGAPFKARA